MVAVVLAGAAIVLLAGLFGVRVSARLGTILGVFEIGVFLVLAVFLVVHAGSNNTLSVFTTKYTPSTSQESPASSRARFTQFSRSADLRAPRRLPRKPGTRAALFSGPCFWPRC